MMDITQCVKNGKRVDKVMNKAEKIKELREQMGMNRKEFCDYFDIPYRTVQDWEGGKREMPDYVLRLLWYKAEMEKLIK